MVVIAGIALKAAGALRPLGAGHRCRGRLGRRRHPARVLAPAAGGDFRAVQGAITVDGLGNLLSGLAGTTPNTATTVGASVTELTGVGARSVGVAAGAIFVAVAFLPKVLAVVLAIPGSVFRGLSRRVAGDALRHRHEDGRPRRDRLPQGP